MASNVVCGLESAARISLTAVLMAAQAVMAASGLYLCEIKTAAVCQSRGGPHCIIEEMDGYPATS